MLTNVQNTIFNSNALVNFFMNKLILMYSNERKMKSINRNDRSITLAREFILRHEKRICECIMLLEFQPLIYNTKLQFGTKRDLYSNAINIFLVFYIFFFL